VTRLGATLSVVSFAVMFALPSLSPQAQLVLLALATVGFDLGVQASLIAHQTIVYGIAPEARSRLNAILMTTMFVGMATGGALGAQALAAWGWNGVVGRRGESRGAGGADAGCGRQVIHFQVRPAPGHGNAAWRCAVIPCRR
jgi:hypothetical protein